MQARKDKRPDECSDVTDVFKYPLLHAKGIEV